VTNEKGAVEIKLISFNKKLFYLQQPIYQCVTVNCQRQIPGERLLENMLDLFDTSRSLKIPVFSLMFVCLSL
jgi:hypothetical protein